MSHLPVTSSSSASASHLREAFDRFEESKALLDHANQDKDVGGSLNNRIEQVETFVKRITGTPNHSADFYSLKLEFIQFMETQLSKYETVQKTHDKGLKAIKLARSLNYPFAEYIEELASTFSKVEEKMRILDIALNQAFFTKKSLEGNMAIPTMLTSWYDNPYLLAAVIEKSSAS